MPNLTLVLLNKLRCHDHFKFTADEITWSRLLLWIHILNVKQCRSRSVGFFRSQLNWIYTVCKGRVYPGSAGQGLTSHQHYDRITWQATFVNQKVQYFPTSNFQPIRLPDPDYWYKFTYLMANSADPDQLVSSEANWSGSTLFAKSGYIQIQQD